MPGVSHPVVLRFRLAARLLTAVAALAPVSFLNAQQVSVQDRAQLLRSSTPPPSDPYSEENGVDNGRAAESPNDADVGEQEILERVERYEPFTASVAIPFYYTSNVALARNGEQSDVLMAPTAGVTYAPRFTRTLYGSVTAERQGIYSHTIHSAHFGNFHFSSRASLLSP